MAVTAWPDLADALVAELVASGKVSASEWQAAMREVPRHEFVPKFYELRDREWREVTPESEPVRWLERVYTNKPLVTQLGELHHGGIGPTSSSSAPSLMARMLEALDLHDTHTVLEIGTGTGYNAALLAHRLGDERVFSVDIDPNLVDAARQRLRHAGYEPHLAAADGAGGWPDDAVRFDRLIATCAVNRVPPAWLRQTRAGGLVLVDLKVGTSAGNLVALHSNGDGTGQGHFLDGHSAFMLMRGETHPPISGYPQRNRRQAHRRHTSVMEERPWESPVWWFLACLSMPPGVRFGYTLHPVTEQPAAVSLSCPDGSWCEVSLEVTRDGRAVWESGPSYLWSAVEQARDIWTAHDQPEWSRLGLTVTAGEHLVWIDGPTGPRWVLPPSSSVVGAPPPGECSAERGDGGHHEQQECE
ncbi:methyltransferase domain-containing protein [Saccharopolyspora rosea]|uniref:methyltransferase domain-containing protein n=1 Tax=Saccharopolyspora rosea TaxID=524884 RepID=UPI0021D9CBE0|nr:methyltransferase domain-containing protein [Saccharopolyspora rosea]